MELREGHGGWSLVYKKRATEKTSVPGSPQGPTWFRTRHGPAQGQGSVYKRQSPFPHGAHILTIKRRRNNYRICWEVIGTMATNEAGYRASCQTDDTLLKPCTSDWDLNPRGRYSYPAKSLTGTRTHAAGTRTWPRPTVFLLRSHTWFQDLMKLRFLMSHHRKNSVRDKVMGKKWSYLERNTVHRQSVGHLRR